MSSKQSVHERGVPPSERVKVKRIPDRGAYDRSTIDAIIDAALICHVGFVCDGQPFVIPTLFARVGDRVVLHGSAGSRLLRALAQGSEVCLTVTLVDGLVLARSIFHHSMNYRSVVILGKATVIADPADKVSALRAMSEHLIPGRWNDVREPNEKELAQTLVVSIPIDEASAKVRSGPPGDEEADYARPTWAGVIQLSLTPSSPIDDPLLSPGLAAPMYIANYAGPGPATIEE